MPPRRKRSDKIRHTLVERVDGGLYDAAPPQAVPLGAWVQADNFRFQDGRAELISGWDNLSGVTGLTGNPMLVDHFWAPSGADRLMLVTSTGSYRIVGDVLSGTWTSVSGMSSTTPDIWSAQYNEVWYCGGYSKTAHKWTGSGNASTVSAIPQGHHAVIWANRLFVGYINESDGESRVYYSAIGNPETWDATDVFNEFEEAGGPITGLAPVSANEMCVHKANGVWRIQFVGGAVPFVIRFVPNVLGAQYRHWLCRGPFGAQFYVAQDNVYFWPGSGSPVPVGDPIFESLQTLQRQALLAPSDLWCAYDQVEGVFLIPHRGSIGTGDETYQSLFAYEFNPRTKSWGYRTFHARSVVPYYDQWGTTELGYRMVMAGRSAGSSHVSVMGRTYGINTSTNIAGRLKSGVFHLGSMFGEKRVHRVRLFTDSSAPTNGSITVRLNTGDNPGNLTAGAADTLDLASTSDRVVEPNTTGRWLQLDITAACRGAAFKLSGFEIEWSYGGR